MHSTASNRVACSKQGAANDSRCLGLARLHLGDGLAAQGEHAPLGLEESSALDLALVLQLLHGLLVLPAHLQKRDGKNACEVFLTQMSLVCSPNL